VRPERFHTPQKWLKSVRCLSDVCQACHVFVKLVWLCPQGLKGGIPPLWPPRNGGGGGGGLGFGLESMKNGPTWISVLQCHPNHTYEGVRTMYFLKRIQGTKCDVISLRGW
jgi:hypothetical protein